MNRINELIEQLKQDAQGYKEGRIPVEWQYSMEKFVEEIKTAPDEIKMEVVEELKRNQDPDEIWLYVYISSVLIHITYDSQYLIELEKFVISCELLELNMKHFLFYQIKVLMFSYKELVTEETKYLKWKLFKQIVQMYEKKWI